MQALSILLPLISLVGFAAFIWLVVVAFKRSAMWGVLVLLLSPITAIIFAIQNWQESKKPFLVYIGSTAATVAIFFIFLFYLGAPMVKMAQQMNDGELTQEEGGAIMEEHMDRMENSGLLSAKEKTQLREMRQMQVTQDDTAEADEGSSTLQAALARAEEPPRENTTQGTSASGAATPESGSVTTTRVSRSRETVSLRNIGNYVGEKFRVITDEGVEIQGYFMGQKDGEYHFTKRVAAGTIDLYLNRDEIRSIEKMKSRPR
jgi:hypothetical protein